MTRTQELSRRGLVVDLVPLGAIALGNLLLIARSSATVPALILIGVAIAALIGIHNVRLVQVPLLLPLALFLFSGWLSIGASYNDEQSWKKFWLIAGGIALYLALAVVETNWARLLTVWGLLLFCSGTALFFVTQQDFAHDPAKLAIANQIGMTLHRIAPQFGFHIPHPNLIAGILLLGLPFAVTGAWEEIRKGSRLTALPYIAVTLWLLFGLGMTTSRGALTAIGVVIVIGAAIWVALRVVAKAGLAENTALVVVLIVGLVGLILFFVIGGRAAPELVNRLLGTANGVPRSEIFREAFQLGEDTPFTGIGLDTFALNYASYARVIDVLFLPHAHNLYLQIWIEQGVLGIVAFGWWMVAFYVWVWGRREAMNWIALAGVAAVSLMLVHGVVDVLLYFSRVLPLMFIPFGLTVSALKREGAPTPMPTARRTGVIAAVTAAVVLVVIALVFLTLRTELLAQWDANRGAVEQAQIELPQYHFSDSILRVVRLKSDETPAMDLFQAALDKDPKNRTANLRMGLIELDQQKFDEAVAHLEAANRADPTNRAARKALGYAYVWVGELDKAVELLQGIDEAPTELQTASGFWATQKRQQLAEDAVKVIAALKQ